MLMAAKDGASLRTFTGSFISLNRFGRECLKMIFLIKRNILLIIIIMDEICFSLWIKAHFRSENVNCLCYRRIFKLYIVLFAKNSVNSNVHVLLHGTFPLPFFYFFVECGANSATSSSVFCVQSCLLV